ncbi:N-acetylglucosamine kinase [Paenibacillus dendritiformis]|uniref:N-acetylglucosamine kinase n=1 Tax=Paenibacillus dendritiformis TaxID=130049 RepID=UPI00143D0230|nr:BadF/BadG/BcrA/BcrD ATPase family protein [Paenibacillus dendritiformis]NKI22324.1 N-acetylglucosamine kinase [Paenibacillus dendritiformis]NRF99510.1 N-acetylglucosamine kinase [Paenibacillus dendritiformis]
MAVRRIPLLAVDGGGTKSLVVFTDRQGQLLGRGQGGPSNYHGSGTKGAIRELAAAIREAIADLERSGGCLVIPEAKKEREADVEVECAVFALAGLDTESDRRAVTRLVEEALALLPLQARHLIVENDGYAALLGATGGQPGILVISGTGSIIYGIDGHGRTARAGGWGHRVGDEGSGYWIGKQAALAILRAYDGRGADTRLKEWVLPYLGMEREEELFDWMYGSAYSIETVSRLSRAVGQAASAGDKEAQRILSAAADELFYAAAAVIRHLSFHRDPFVAIMQGGVLQHEGRVREALMRRIEAYAPHVQWDDARREPIYGVIAMGLSYFREKGKGETCE